MEVATTIFFGVVKFTSATYNTTNSSNSSGTSDEDFHHGWEVQTARLVRLTFLLVNAAVALVGNSLSLAVFTRSRHLGRAPSSGYLAALAVADTGSALMSALGIALSMYGSLSTILFCNVVFFLSYVFQFLAVWLVVCFTAERYVSVCHPLRAKEILGKLREHRMVVVLVLGACAIYSPQLVSAKALMYEPHLRAWTCDWINDVLEVTYMQSFAYVTFALHFAVPMALIGILNLLIIHQLCWGSRSGAELGHRARDEREAQNRYITLTLLVVCVAFFLCHFPFNLVYLLTIMDVQVNRWVYQATQMLFKMSYSTNFFLYAMSGTHFRTSLKALLRRGGDRDRDSTLYRMSDRATSSTRDQ